MGHVLENVLKEGESKWNSAHRMTLFFCCCQILLEPAVIQDVLSAGSHLQLLELLSLCSHYLIQVHNTHTQFHASFHILQLNPDANFTHSHLKENKEITWW